MKKRTLPSKMTEDIVLYHGNCLDVMPTLPEKSIDLILADLPYGTTACKWDTVIPFEPLWEQYKRLIKPRGAIVLFGNEPFTSLLICSNLAGFKYRWDWDKKIPSGMSYARYRPMQQVEDIAVFTRDGEPATYNPQVTLRNVPIKGGGMGASDSAATIGYVALKKTYTTKQPTTLLCFDKVRRGAVHPTQKPVALLEYLIRTYTNEGDLVLDNVMGSGSTGVACINMNRGFIGIEILPDPTRPIDPKTNPDYFKIAAQRIELAIEEGQNESTKTQNNTK